MSVTFCNTDSRVTTFSGKTGNLEKSGNSKMVREMSGKMQKVTGKPGIFFLLKIYVHVVRENLCNTTFIMCL